MFCPECGTKNDDDALFCSECGTSLREYWEDSQTEKFEDHNIRQRIYQGVVQQSPEQENYRQQGYEQDFADTAVPRPARHLSKTVVFAVVEGVLAVGLLAGAYVSLDKKFSPETAAGNYWKAMMAQEWSKAYDYCDFPENEFLTKQMYVNVNSKEKEKVDYHSFKVRSQDTVPDSDTRTLAVEYLVKGNGQKDYTYLTLARTGEKQFLFWDQWKVTSADSWCTDVSFKIPSDATLYLNGVEVKEKRVPSETDPNMSSVTIPYLFLGSYQIEVKAEGMKTYRKTAEIGKNGYYENYIELIPSEETLKSLVEQMGNDIKNIMEAALSGKDFSEVKKYFTEEAVKDGYVKSSYESFMEQITDEDTGIVSLQISDIQAAVQNINESSYLQMAASMEIDETYHSYWKDELESNKDTIEFYPYYQKETDGWKLMEFPLTYYQF